MKAGDWVITKKGQHGFRPGLLLLLNSEATNRDLPIFDAMIGSKEYYFTASEIEKIDPVGKVFRVVFPLSPSFRKEFACAKADGCTVGLSGVDEEFLSGDLVLIQERGRE